MTDLRDRVWTELLECYSEGASTDWQYLTDLCDLIVSMIQRESSAPDATSPNNHNQGATQQ